MGPLLNCHLDKAIIGYTREKSTGQMPSGMKENEPFEAGRAGRFDTGEYHSYNADYPTCENAGRPAAGQEEQRVKEEWQSFPDHYRWMRKSRAQSRGTAQL